MREKIEELVKKHNVEDFKWIDPHTIVVGQWVRMKCLYGCGEYGKTATCPPNVPSITECEKFFREYTSALVIHFEKFVDRPEDRHAWTRKINESLLAVERDVFLAGNHKALVLYIDPCNICGDCVPGRDDCRNPEDARPSLEGLGVDVFGTVRKQGYEIEVLDGYDRKMNRYGMLLVR